jgi:hypothetical protein
MDTSGERPAAMRSAVAYALRHWSVVPLHTPDRDGCSCRRTACPAPGKHPRIRWQPAMARRATVAEIVAWWRRWPDANVGIVTGTISRLAVVDVDPRHGGEVALTALEAAHVRLPATVEVRTGGGGRHLWFATGLDRVPSALLGPGVELKAEGSIVVAPPSIHGSGIAYEWLAGSAPWERAIAVLPGWLAAADRTGPGHAGHGTPAIPRTEAEQRGFAAAWARAGIRLREGDAYYCCPFHPDEHPSLHVDAAGCRWYCFGCRRGGGIGALLELLGERPPRMPRRRLRAAVGDQAPVTLDGTTAVEVVGESRHQDDLLRLVGRRPYGGVEVTAVAELVPEPDNPADPAAVAVAIDGRPVGYLARDDARRLRATVVAARRTRGAATARAVIRGGWDRGRSDVGSLGVVLFLPAPSPAPDAPPTPRAAAPR